jgi:hypothetical protein
MRRDDRTIEHSGPAKTGALPADRVLSTWSACDWSDGVHVEALAVLDRLVVHTENSVYEIVVRAPSTGDVLVRGGAFFPVLTPAHLAGSSLGGSFLKLRSIHVGFRLELTTDRGCIITSPVRGVTMAAAVAVPTEIM